MIRLPPPTNLANETLDQARDAAIDALAAAGDPPIGRRGPVGIAPEDLPLYVARVGHGALKGDPGTFAATDLDAFQVGQSKATRAALTKVMRSGVRRIRFGAKSNALPPPSVVDAYAAYVSVQPGAHTITDFIAYARKRGLDSVTQYLGRTPAKVAYAQIAYTAGFLGQMDAVAAFNRDPTHPPLGDDFIVGLDGWEDTALGNRDPSALSALTAKVQDMARRASAAGVQRIELGNEPNLIAGQKNRGFSWGNTRGAGVRYTFEDLARGYGALEGTIYQALKKDRSTKGLLVDSAAMAFNESAPFSSQNDGAAFLSYAYDSQKKLGLLGQGGRFASDELNLHAYGAGPRLEAALADYEDLGGMLPARVWVSEVGGESTSDRSRYTKEVFQTIAAVAAAFPAKDGAASIQAIDIFDGSDGLGRDFSPDPSLFVDLGGG